MRRKQKRGETQPEADAGTDVVTLEYFDQSTGVTELYVELSRLDFDRYSLAAENLGRPVEDLVLEAARAEVNDQNTQWVLPAVDSHGNIDLKNGTPMVLPSFGKDDQ